MDALTPDTSFAIMQASQSDLGAVQRKLQSMQAAKNARQMDKIDATAQEFEAVFLTEMLKPMFEGIEVDSQFGGGKGEEIFRGFMLQEYGKLLAQTGRIGIADQVKAELIKRQGLEEQDTINEVAASQEDTAFNAIINDLTKDGDL